MLGNVDMIATADSNLFPLRLAEDFALIIAEWLRPTRNTPPNGAGSSIYINFRYTDLSAFRGRNSVMKEVSARNTAEPASAQRTPPH